MSATLIGIIGILILLAVLFFLGMPVGFAMGIVGFCGFWYVVSFKAAINVVGTDIWGTFSKYGLTVIPLFIFLGYLAFNSGIAERLYNKNPKIHIFYGGPYCWNAPKGGLRQSTPEGEPDRYWIKVSCDTEGELIINDLGWWNMDMG